MSKCQNAIGAWFTIALLVVLAQSGRAQTSAPDFRWARAAGGTGDDEAFCIAIDGAGNVYVVGDFAGITSFGTNVLASSGSSDAFVAKLDANGNWLWAQKAGGTGFDRGLSVAADGAGNVYLAGYFGGTASFGSNTLVSSGSSDAFVAKLDANGNWLWAKQAGGTGFEQAGSVTVGSAGVVYVAGQFDGIALFGTNTLLSAGSSDAFVAKLDANGNWLWAKQAGGPFFDHAGSVAVDGTGNIYVAGQFQATAAFGTTALDSSGGVDAFVAKLDASGNWLWAKRAGGTSNDAAYSVALDGSGNVYFAGWFSGTASFGTNTLAGSDNSGTFVAKLDASGNWLWVRYAGGSNIYGVASLATDIAGNIYFGGGFDGTTSFGPNTLVSSGSFDAFIAKLDASGNWLWARSAGGAIADSAFSVAVDGGGNVYLAGYFGGTASFGSRTMVSSGGYDAFVAQLDTGIIASITPSARQSFSLGGGFSLSVTAGGTGPLAYQWQFNGVNIPSATNATLSLTNLTATNAGAYRVVVTNAYGTAITAPVDVYFYGDLKFIAATVLAGSIGQQYRVDYADVVTVGTTNWLVLTNITLPSSPYLVIDPSSAGRTQRYYRAVPVP
jgi:hypothetical protein